MLLGERVEHDHVVEAVQELRVEDVLHLLLHLLRDPLEVLRRVSPRREAELLALRDVPRADVRRHDHDRVLEVDHPAVVVREMSFVEHLEQDVEHVRVRLLDLVEQDRRCTACGARPS